MGEILPEGSEAALVNRLRERGRPKKVQHQSQSTVTQQTPSDEDIPEKDELVDDSMIMPEENDTINISNMENSPSPHPASSSNVS